jgi:deoxyribodipyrimidine photo-lyase
MRNIRSTIVWFRQDLRLVDNPALLAATAAGAAIIPIFIWSPQEEGHWPPGAASCWWLHQSLTQLDASLRSLGSRLIIRRGSSLQTIRELLDQTGATSVYWNRRYEPAARARDRQLQSALLKLGVESESFNGSLLFEPESIKTKEGKPYLVFTPFWRNCLEYSPPPQPQPALKAIKSPHRWPTSLQLKELNLLPKLNWANGFAKIWNPGEAGAAENFNHFLKQSLSQYSIDRDLPAKICTSRLSPHLHFGEISIRQIWADLKKQKNSPAVKRYQSELGWREFAYHLLFHFPQTTRNPLRKEFSKFPWLNNRAKLRAWQQGRTGYPIVDAGLRELWQTGWMHNRVRMIVASFLVKDLLISWQQGAAWFWDTLLDADLANNTLGWQWTAGCGADAAPYFRIFNPTSQGQKFDPQGEYVRRWIPELADLPDEFLHSPSQAPEEILTRASIELGKTYPHPIVDHRSARVRALTAFKKLKNKSSAGMQPM